MFITRRRFLFASAVAAGSLTRLPKALGRITDGANDEKIKLGLVTYLWGQDWDLPTLLTNCEASGILGVELRTEHKHGVEPTLSPAERQEVRKRFADSPITLVGYGSNAEFHSNDPTEVRRNIELTKAYVQLMHDCGGQGVKVKPNGFVKDVPHAQTLEQIGRALNEVGAYAADFGQTIRLEVHGHGTDELPHIKAIMDVATHPNVGVCWNSNATDLKGEGLEHNFRLVSSRVGDTIHVQELNAGEYPYPKLMELLIEIDFTGWILLECRSKVSDRVAALAEQKRVFQTLVANARGGNDE
ncbi:MAG: sugar phosphate isomerase/epimerase family protein [Pirellulaceae bacterium]